MHKSIANIDHQLLTINVGRDRKLKIELHL